MHVHKNLQKFQKNINHGVCHKHKSGTQFMRYNLQHFGDAAIFYKLNLNTILHTLPQSDDNDNCGPTRVSTQNMMLGN